VSLHNARVFLNNVEVQITNSGADEAR